MFLFWCFFSGLALSGLLEKHNYCSWTFRHSTNPILVSLPARSYLYMVVVVVWVFLVAKNMLPISLLFTIATSEPNAVTSVPYATSVPYVHTTSTAVTGTRRYVESCSKSFYVIIFVLVFWAVYRSLDIFLYLRCLSQFGHFPDFFFVFLFSETFLSCG